MRYEVEELSGGESSPFVGRAVVGPSELRNEIYRRNAVWAREQRLAHELSVGASPVVLYWEDERGRHGNFHPASYPRIRRNSDWNLRLGKAHTSAVKILVSHERRRELDSCNSSDALLMSVFCHPRNSKRGSGLRRLLGLGDLSDLRFGYKPRIPLKNGRVDSTEIDLRFGDLLIEAKLTESDFQSARSQLVERYRDLNDVFEADELPRSGDEWQSYQLIRGVLAAHAKEGSRFCVLCDARRRDLISDWYRVLQAVRIPDLRCHLTLLTWQEIAAVCPRSLQQWLAAKYGINAPVAVEAARWIETV